MEAITKWFADIGAWFTTIFGTDTASMVWTLVALGAVIVGWIVQAVLVGSLARSKGYGFFGNFVLGLFFGTFALIYQAGRPVSYERECVMQDRLALQMARELFKLQRSRERSNQQQQKSIAAE